MTNEQAHDFIHRYNPTYFHPQSPIGLSRRTYWQYWLRSCVLLATVIAAEYQEAGVAALVEDQMAEEAALS